MAGKSRFSISAVISMVDKVSGPMKKAGNSVAGFSAKARRQFSRLDVNAKSINKSINKVGGKAARVGMLSLGVGAGLVVREFVKFDDAIFGATARFKAAEGPGADMVKVMADLRAAARKVGAETQFTATQVAQGLDKFALAGFTSAESIAVMRSQVDLATATGEDFMRVADISSDLLGAFGGNALQSAEKVAMLKEMNAQLAVATVSANVTMEDLFETLKIAAPIGKTAGASMSDLIATTALLGSTGIKGSMAATAIKNIFSRLVKPTKDVEDGMAALGLSTAAFVNQQGGMKTTTEIFGLIGEKMKGMKDVAKAKIFAQIFGARAFAGAANIKDNIAGITDMLVKLGKDPQKQLREMSDFMRQSFGNQLKILGSAFESVGFKIITAFAGPGRDALGKFAESVRNFDVAPVITGLRALGVVLGAMLALIKIMAPFVDILVGAFVGFKVAMLANVVAVKILDGALKASSFGWILTIIGLIVAVVFRLVRMWNQLKETFQKDGLLSAIAQFFGFGGKATVNHNVTGQPGTVPPGGFASPESRTINNNSTTTSNANLDVNFNNAPPGTQVKQGGRVPPGMTLNTGFDGAGA
jgi:TP901 family phage tail tape measure protein